MPVSIPENCPICHNAEFREYKFGGLEECSRCNHVRRSQTESGEEIQIEHFGENFVARSALSFEVFYEYLNNRTRTKQLGRVLNHGARVLEVGVGHGRLLRTLVDSGYCAEGIDLSLAVARAAHSAFQVTVHCTSIRDFARTSERGAWDAIVMCHVLEHFQDPLAALEAARVLLKPRGILFLAVPNVSAPEARLPGWTGYAPYHFHYFRPATLSQLLRNCGFQVQRVETFEPFSGWFNALTRSMIGVAAAVCADHGRFSGRHSPIRLAYDIARIAFGALLSPIRWLQSAAGYGEELTIVART